MTLVERLPRHPVPQPGESLSSWLIRLAQVNGQRLSFISHYLSGNHNFWKHDPDKFLNDDVLLNLQRATGLPIATFQDMQLARYAGLLYPELLSRGSGRWVLPLARRFYENQRLAALYCPECLKAGSASPVYVRLEGRLSFMLACPQHGTLLRDCCPHCAAPFAPHLNDLGRGQEWQMEEAPFGWCPACQQDIRVATAKVFAGEMAFQQRLLTALVTGQMEWPGLGSVPALEGFNVLYKLLGVLTLEAVQKAVQEQAGRSRPENWPERSNRSFEDFDFVSRRALLGQLDFLVADWPLNLERVVKAAGLTRRPLVLNMSEIPVWYDAVADRFSLANRCRPYKQIPLVEHCSRQSLANYRGYAKTESERRRWDILWHYYAEPNATLVAQKLGVRWDFVARTVNRFNVKGPAAIKDPRRERMNRKRRLLTEAQEQELKKLLAASESSPSNEVLANWFQERIGVRPDNTTLWIYRRRAKLHTIKGRQAEKTS